MKDTSTVWRCDICFEGTVAAGTDRPKTFRTFELKGPGYTSLFDVCSKCYDYSSSTFGNVDQKRADLFRRIWQKFVRPHAHEISDRKEGE